MNRENRRRAARLRVDMLNALDEAYEAGHKSGYQEGYVDGFAARTEPVLCDRCSESTSERISVPLNFRTRIWIINGEQRIVRPILRRLFVIFWKRRGRAVTIDTLMNSLYSMRSDPPSDKVVNVYISQLRRLLDGSEFTISFGHKDKEVGWQLLEDTPALQEQRQKLREAAKRGCKARFTRRALHQSASFLI